MAKRAVSARTTRFCVPMCFLLGLLFCSVFPQTQMASVTCDEKVTKIEVLYRAATGKLTAQISLVNGLTVPWTPTGEEDRRMLMELLDIMSGAKPMGLRVYLLVEEDVVKGFRLVASN